MNPIRAYVEKFVMLPEEAWDELLPLFEEKSFKRGDLFAKEGKAEIKIGFLLHGIARSFYINESGTEYNKIFNSAPGFIGAYSSITTGNINKINIEMMTPSVALVADYREIQLLFDKYKELERFARKLAEFYLAYKEKREIERELMEAKQRYVLFRKEFPDLENKIALYHIASYLGITPHHLSMIRGQRC